MKNFDFKVEVDVPEFIGLQQHHDVKEEPLFLSNIDQTVLFPVQTLYFYKAVQGRSCKTVIGHLKEGLHKVLREYHFLTGRHRLSKDGIPRLEIDCNGSGVQFAGAHAFTTIQDLGDLSIPNSSFQKFVPQPHGVTTVAECPLMMIQVT